VERRGKAWKAEQQASHYTRHVRVSFRSKTRAASCKLQRTKAAAEVVVLDEWGGPAEACGKGSSRVGRMPD
jgi:hypothetical protein